MDVKIQDTKLQDIIGVFTEIYDTFIFKTTTKGGGVTVQSKLNTLEPIQATNTINPSNVTLLVGPTITLTGKLPSVIDIIMLNQMHRT